MFALESSATPAAIRTRPSAVRSTPCGHFTDMFDPRITPGTEPARMFAARPKSTLPLKMWAIPAAHSRIAAWKTSVPTTRLGVRR